MRIFILALLVFCFVNLQLVFCASLTEGYLVELGENYFKHGRFSDAEMEFRKCLILNPGNEKAKRYLADIRSNTGLGCADRPAYYGVCAGRDLIFSVANPDCGDSNYFWDFGDGTFYQDGSRVIHNYPGSGEYKVSIVVDRIQRDSSCLTEQGVMVVDLNNPPFAAGEVSLACCLGKPTLFDASGSFDPDGDPLTYFWDFGDGNTSQGEITGHIYPQGGNYKVTLVVNDNKNTSCSSAAAEMTASVAVPPVAKMEIKQQ